MTDPQRSSRSANTAHAITYGYLGTATAVDTVTGVCSVDPGDGNPISEVLYLGAAPKVGAQVAVLIFRNACVVLGGTG